MAKEFIVLSEKDEIISLIEDKSKIMTEHIKNNNKSQFILYGKSLTHSDLPTFGKATKINSLEDNLLYYLTVDEMRNIEKREMKNFQTAKQSNIGLSNSFWEDIEMPNPRDTVSSDISVKKLNNYAEVYIVNDAMKYFKTEYTLKVFKSLNKKLKKDKEKYWNKENSDVSLSEEQFTKINVTQAVHGLGTARDTNFLNLRKQMFKNDQLFILIERNNSKKVIYIIPVKNPRFFTLIGEANSAWEEFQVREKSRIENAITNTYTQNIEASSRNYQDRWRRQLAEEMMNFTTREREVFCPFTFVTSDFDTAGTIYRASHIKNFSECSDYEKYDVNNGLLLVANADALFDKHLITVDENKNLIFSFLISQDTVLINRLLLNQPIFTDIFNEKRMAYIEEHRKKFYEKEENRKR